MITTPSEGTAVPLPASTRSAATESSILAKLVTTQVNQDVFEILEALKKIEGNEGKDDAELIREGIYQLFLKYAEHKETRELIFDKIRTVVD